MSTEESLHTSTSQSGDGSMDSHTPSRRKTFSLKGLLPKSSSSSKGKKKEVVNPSSDEFRTPGGGRNHHKSQSSRQMDKSVILRAKADLLERAWNNPAGEENPSSSRSAVGHGSGVPDHSVQASRRGSRIHRPSSSTNQRETVPDLTPRPARFDEQFLTPTSSTHHPRRYSQPNGLAHGEPIRTLSLATSRHRVPDHERPSTASPTISSDRMTPALQLPVGDDESDIDPTVTPSGSTAPSSAMIPTPSSIDPSIVHAPIAVFANNGQHSLAYPTQSAFPHFHYVSYSTDPSQPPPYDPNDYGSSINGNQIQIGGTYAKDSGYQTDPHPSSNAVTATGATGVPPTLTGSRRIRPLPPTPQPPS